MRTLQLQTQRICRNGESRCIISYTARAYHWPTGRPLVNNATTCYYCAPLGTSMLFSSQKALFDFELRHHLEDVNSKNKHKNDDERFITSTATAPTVSDATANFFLNQPATDEGACGLNDEWSERERCDLKNFIRRAESASEGQAVSFTKDSITRVVDIGCGTGRFSVMWPEMFQDLEVLVLVEPCGHFLDAAIEKLKSKYRVTQNSIKNSDSQNTNVPFGSTKNHCDYCFELQVRVGGYDGAPNDNARKVLVECYQLTVEEYMRMGAQETERYKHSGLLITTGVAQYLTDEQLVLLTQLEEWTIMKEDVSVAAYTPPLNEPIKDGTIHFTAPTLAQHEALLMEKIKTKKDEDSGKEDMGRVLVCEIPVALCYPTDGGTVRTLRHFEELLGKVGTLSSKNNKDMDVCETSDGRCRFALIHSGIQWDLPSNFFSPLCTWLLKRVR